FLVVFGSGPGVDRIRDGLAVVDRYAVAEVEPAEVERVRGRRVIRDPERPDNLGDLRRGVVDPLLVDNAGREEAEVRRDGRVRRRGDLPQGCRLGAETVLVPWVAEPVGPRNHAGVQGPEPPELLGLEVLELDRKSTRLNSSHVKIS